ncbi:hypothetical protein DERP_002048 [Dermatophagoides pteronyssinus]|uniref:Uncharacterized protein n=1 Tax=Dermatophagoides pteronyssinus TaxID=6956 RepID=A0ABQ8JGM1_DERPT|nr:hypothetical protein DERP_002048 [Dermatophagoides pteronyssinus]
MAYMEDVYVRVLKLYIAGQENNEYTISLNCRLANVSAYKSTAIASKSVCLMLQKIKIMFLHKSKNGRYISWPSK